MKKQKKIYFGMYIQVLKKIAKKNHQSSDGELTSDDLSKSSETSSETSSPVTTSSCFGDSGAGDFSKGLSPRDSQSPLHTCSSGNRSKSALVLNQRSLVLFLKILKESPGERQLIQSTNLEQKRILKDNKTPYSKTYRASRTCKLVKQSELQSSREMIACLPVWMKSQWLRVWIDASVSSSGLRVMKRSL